MSKVCLNLRCFANHHGECLGDKEFAKELNQCTLTEEEDEQNE